MEAGADGVELDVHLTRDERVVVVHDDTVVGAGGVPIAVRQMSLAQIREIDAGGGEPIPTLDEALDAAGAQAIVNIELKGTSVTSEGLERAVVRVVHEHRMSERVILSSFNPFRLWRVGCLGPQLPRAMLHGPGTPIFLRDLWLLPLVQPDALHPDHSLVDEAYMKRAQMWGVRVNVWTVDDPAEARRLLELGVDALITNDPRRLRGVV